MLAQITAVAPSSTALLMAKHMPRSLNDPVGLRPSSFTCTSSSRHSDSASSRTSGVAPSPMLITGVASVTGRNSR